jgi:hypothetical protein
MTCEGFVDCAGCDECLACTPHEHRAEYAFRLTESSAILPLPMTTDQAARDYATRCGGTALVRVVTTTPWRELPA